MPADCYPQPWSRRQIRRRRGQITKGELRGGSKEGGESGAWAYRRTSAVPKPTSRTSPPQCQKMLEILEAGDRSGDRRGGSGEEENKAREGGNTAGEGSKARERTKRQNRIKEGAGARDPEEAKMKLELKTEQK